MTVVGNGHAGVLQRMRGGLRTVRRRRAHLVLILEAAHVALPFFFVAFVTCDGGETIEGAGGVRARLAAGLTAKCCAGRLAWGNSERNGEQGARGWRCKGGG